MTQQEIEDAALGQFVVLERQKAVTDYKARLLERLEALGKDATTISEDSAQYSDAFDYWNGRSEAIADVKKIVEELS